MTKRRSCPGSEARAPSTPPPSVATSNDTAPRCRRCRRGLTAPLSVERCHGPVCWHRRRDAAERLALLDCGCADPWVCRCTQPPLTDHQIEGWKSAAERVLGVTGNTPLLPLEVLRALYRRGGQDRALAEQLHAATGGAVA